MIKHKLHIAFISTIILISSVFCADNTVTREMWIDHMQEALPGYFCKNESYFRSCFQVSEEQCLYVADAATSTCLARFTEQIPDSLNQPQDGTHWGEKVGACAGTLYEYKLIKVRISSQKCDDPSYWQ